MVRHPIGGSRSVIVLFVDPITCTAGGERRVVADHVRTLLRDMGRRRRISVAVIGSGVIGLTVASELRRRWPVCGSSSSKSRLPVGGAINTGEYWLMVSRISATSPTVRAVIDPVSCRLMRIHSVLSITHCDPVFSGSCPRPCGRSSMSAPGVILGTKPRCAPGFQSPSSGGRPRRLLTISKAFLGPDNTAVIAILCHPMLSPISLGDKTLSPGTRPTALPSCVPML
jgi:hypothetical protein